MGHERVGILPKSQKWRDIVNEISNFSVENDNVPDIAQDTLKNVRTRFEKIHKDTGVQSAFEFFVILSFASKQTNPEKFLSENGINLPDNFTPLKLAKELNNWVNENKQSFEYATFAAKAGIDTISEWYQTHENKQLKLFDFGNAPYEIWRIASTGSGFCDLARRYFANFTNRYLNYFLEREASANINSINLRNEFKKQLEEHINEISKHAFETAKITQSFAAGWFNKNVKEEIPSKRKIEGFLAIAFGKIKGELLMEEAK